MIVAVASLIVLLAGAAAVAVFVGVRALSGHQLEGDLRRFDEPAQIRPTMADEEVARAA